MPELANPNAPLGSSAETQFDLSEVYTADPRPTVIVDTTKLADTRGVHLEFANDAFTQHYGVLLRFIMGGHILEPDFLEWLKSPHPSRAQYQLGDLTWSFFLLKDRWKVVNITAARVPCCKHDPSLVDQRSASPSTEINTQVIASQGAMDMEEVNLRRKQKGSGLVVALPSGLVSLGSAPTALEGLHRSVDMLDVGFFEYDLEGTLIFANKSWYALSGHPYSPESHTQLRFIELCHPDDIEAVRIAWATLQEGNAMTFEMRWKSASSPSAQALGAQWVLAACIPLYDENGIIRSISGCTTDINNQKLSEKIAHSRALAMERAKAFEQRFVRFANIAPVGVFTLDASSKMTYCNDRWFEWTTTSKKPFEEIDITEGFVEADSQKWSTLIEQSILDQTVNSVNMRTNRVWHASDGRRAQAWVLVSVFAEFTKEGEYQGITGTLTDISELKYAEALQRMRLDDALEAKRSQENFMDMTSHEIRNPLSVMVQCTDSAILAISDIAALTNSSKKENGRYWIEDSAMQQLIEQTDLASDGLETIQSCCAHMCSIVDDVLTLSKIDSNLVTITPIRTQPRVVLEEVIRLFEIEARSSGVELSIEIDESIERLGVQYLMFDPSRVKQILINLLTNAIKFTRTEPVRKVSVRMAATDQAPSTCSKGVVRYTPTLRTVPDGLLNEAEWGEGKPIYLQYAVHDTGRGLTPRERAKLFARFSQASPKTHVVYGGSGLGLFITRQLTELQGGEIGVSSEDGKGSSFAFYIMTRQTTSPETIEHSLTPPSQVTISLVGTPQETKPGAAAANVASSAPTKKHRVRPPPPSNTAAQSLLPAWNPVILIVEDNIVNQKVLSTQLKRLGCKTFVAGNGVEALEFIKTTHLWQDPEVQTLKSQEELDIILMDIEMPVMGGLECTRKIREYEERRLIGGCPHRAHHQLPIISISANARAEQAAEQKEAGVDDIVIKPFRIQQLMDKILNLVGRDARADQGMLNVESPSETAPPSPLLP